jgi:predicted fused transcriptional regulator/phosphomethylpyrimidine kinase
MGITQFSKLLAEKGAKEIIQKKISEKAITELSKNVAKALGKEVTKKSISRTTGRIIPIVGGAINATFAYYALRKIGNNLVKNMMNEHIEVKPNVIYYWTEEN